MPHKLIETGWLLLRVLCVLRTSSDNTVKDQDGLMKTQHRSLCLTLGAVYSSSQSVFISEARALQMFHMHILRKSGCCRVKQLCLREKGLVGWREGEGGQRKIIHCKDHDNKPNTQPYHKALRWLPAYTCVALSVPLMRTAVTAATPPHVRVSDCVKRLMR